MPAAEQAASAVDRQHEEPRTGAPACRLVSIPRRRRSRRRADQAWQSSPAGVWPGTTSKAASGVEGWPARLPSPLRGLRASPAATWTWDQ